jgi:hypothetical protein
LNISAPVMIFYLVLLAIVGNAAHFLASFVVHGYGAAAGWLMTGGILIACKFIGERYDL